MNNEFGNDNVVGVDPSFLETVEALDVLPPSANTGKPSSPKKSSAGKKILFTILVLALMAGVAYAVYYFLNLGKQKTSSIKVELSNVNLLLGETLPEDLNEYGTFSGVSANSCTINLLQVNTNEIGQYPYTVTCGSQTFSAFVNVINSTKTDVATKIVFIAMGDAIEAKDFIENPKDEVKYTFVGEVGDFLNKLGGPFTVSILVDDGVVQETVQALIVINDAASFNLTCTKENETVIYSFDSNTRAMNPTKIRVEKMAYESERAYDDALKGNAEALRVMDNVSHTISMVYSLDTEELSKEYGGNFPTTYKEVRNYYKSLNYEC